MYDNIGGKLKSWAKILLVLGAVGFLLIGIALCILETRLMIICGIVVMIVGIPISCVGSMVLYGFGELIEKACEIERNTRGMGTGSEIKKDLTKSIPNTYNLDSIMSIPKRNKQEE